MSLHQFLHGDGRPRVGPGFFPRSFAGRCLEAGLTGRHGLRRCLPGPCRSCGFPAGETAVAGPAISPGAARIGPADFRRRGRARVGSGGAGGVTRSSPTLGSCISGSWSRRTLFRREGCRQFGCGHRGQGPPGGRRSQSGDQQTVMRPGKAAGRRSRSRDCPKLAWRGMGRTGLPLGLGPGLLSITGFSGHPQGRQRLRQFSGGRGLAFSFLP